MRSSDRHGVGAAARGAGPAAYPAPEAGAARVIAVLISYNAASIAAELDALAEQVEATIVVDNGSEEAACAALRAEVGAARGEVALVELPQNAGIAAAQITGIARARAAGATHVLLCDHDSIPAADMVETLLDAMASDARIGAAGPLAAEDRTGADELVYVARKWTPQRATKQELARPILDVAFLIASGCLIDVRALEDVGDMCTQMFIDHVDLEWGLRARRAGWRLVCAPGARLHHSLGDDVVMLPGRAQPVHVHAPIRNYYLVRNTVELVRSSLMPARWRVRYVWWTGKYIAFNALLAGRGRERRKLLRRGFDDGVHGRLGRIGHPLP